MPGTGFKKLARQWATELEQIADLPYDTAEGLIVREFSDMMRRSSYRPSSVTGKRVHAWFKSISTTLCPTKNDID